MHMEILDQKRLRILKKIPAAVSGIPYSLAGGTGLSLQMGLRMSYDFDFFTEKGFNPDTVYRSLASIAEESISAINVDSSGTCDVLLDGVQVSFLLPVPQYKSVRGV